MKSHPQPLPREGSWDENKFKQVLLAFMLVYSYLCITLTQKSNNSPPLKGKRPTPGPSLYGGERIAIAVF